MTLYRKNLAVRKSQNHTYVACLTFPLQPLDDLNIFCDHATFLPQDDNQNFLSPWHSACMIQPGPQVACCDPPRWPSSPPALHAAGATPSPPSSANSPGRSLSLLNQLLRDKTISPCYRHGLPRLRGRSALFPIESSPPWRQRVRTIFFWVFVHGFRLMAGWWKLHGFYIWLGLGVW